MAAGIAAIMARVAMARTNVPLHLFMGYGLFRSGPTFKITVFRSA
jgi:hypothetical protein